MIKSWSWELLPEGIILDRAALGRQGGGGVGMRHRGRALLFFVRGREGGCGLGACEGEGRCVRIGGGRDLRAAWVELICLTLDGGCEKRRREAPALGVKRVGDRPRNGATTASWAVRKVST